VNPEGTTISTVFVPDCQGETIDQDSVPLTAGEASLKTVNGERSPEVSAALMEPITHARINGMKNFYTKEIMTLRSPRVGDFSGLP
jgi:hypothetical protein